MKRTDRRPLPDRFWEKVDKSGGPDACWPWTGSTSFWGYGKLGSGGKHGRTLAAHRLSYEMATGEKLRAGDNVCHRCDNPPCVNPAHLFRGNQADNVRDCIAKGRVCRGSRGVHLLHGEKHPASKLTNAEAQEVRAMRKQGLTFQAIGDRFGVHREQARRICSGESRAEG